MFDSNKILIFSGNCTNRIAKVNLLLTFLLPNANLRAGNKGKDPRTVQHVQSNVLIGVTLGPAWRSPKTRTPNWPQTSTRDNSTNMDPMQEAVEEMESQQQGAELSYIKVAEKHGVSQHTLARRYKGI